MSSLYHSLETIGSTEYINLAGVQNIPAKIDTGADSSAVWASRIDMRRDGTLIFSLFDQESPFYTGEQLEVTNYMVKVIRSSYGDEQIRYRVKLPVIIKGKSFETTFTLANRSRNKFPVLIGRRTIKKIFLVDVSKSSILRQNFPNTKRLNRELKQDPYRFHQKYIIANKQEGDL